MLRCRRIMQHEERVLSCRFYVFLPKTYNLKLTTVHYTYLANFLGYKESTVPTIFSSGL